MKIGKKNVSQWELVQKVLSGVVQETDPAFQEWLKGDAENEKLYRILTGGEKANPPFDKDKAFNRISDKLGFDNQKKTPFYRRLRVQYAACALAVSLMGLTGYLLLTGSPKPEITVNIEKDISDPGSKKAYLLTSGQETIDLSESFELKNADGTVVSNKSEGIISFQGGEEVEKEVELHTIYVPKSGEYELLLTDGTKVYLNSESKLIFPSRFEGSVRQVELTGEAYFEVKKNTKPFVIQTASLHIEVLGTSFNVNAYDDNSSVHTTLVNGSVQVFTPGNQSTYLLTPDNNLSFDKTSRQVSIHKVNTDLYTAWVKGEFIFRNQPLGEIITQLQRWYDFDVIYENPAIKFMRFTGSAEKARPLHYLLNQIQTVTDVKYKKEGKKIILY